MIIIIIMSCRRHGYPWPSLATSPYRSSPLVGLQGHIPYPHIAAGCLFELVVLLLPGHMWGSIGVHHLWARLCFSSCDQPCLVRLTWIVFVMGGRWTATLHMMIMISISQELFVSTHLYHIKYFYQIRIILKQIWLIDRILTRSIRVDLGVMEMNR